MQIFFYFFLQARSAVYCKTFKIWTPWCTIVLQHTARLPIAGLRHSLEPFLQDPEAEDAAQIVRTLAVHRHCGPKVRVVVELLQPEKAAGAIWDETDQGIEIICLDLTRFKLLARRFSSLYPLETILMLYWFLLQVCVLCSVFRLFINMEGCPVLQQLSYQRLVNIHNQSFSFWTRYFKTIERTLDDEIHARPPPRSLPSAFARCFHRWTADLWAGTWRIFYIFLFTHFFVIIARNPYWKEKPESGRSATYR